MKRKSKGEEGRRGEFQRSWNLSVCITFYLVSTFKGMVGEKRTV